MNEEKNNQESCCSLCKGGKMMCNMRGMQGKCNIIRWVLAILILWAVFMGGVKIGELKGMIDKDVFRKYDHIYGSKMMYGDKHGFKNQKDGGCIYMKKTPTTSAIEETAQPDLGQNVFE